MSTYSYRTIGYACHKCAVCIEYADNSVYEDHPETLKLIESKLDNMGGYLMIAAYPDEDKRGTECYFCETVTFSWPHEVTLS